MRKFLISIFAILFCNCAVLASDYQTFKLENGQNVIIKEVKDNPIVIIDTWIGTGSVNETDKNNGVAHFLEHMFFKGTSKYSARDFDKILEAKGAITNAATSKDYTHYHITIPSKDFDTALELHADMLQNPLIPRVELEKERKVVLEEIAKNQDSPQRILYKNLISQIYKTHPYKREVIGTKNVIETITREDMLEFYNNFYIPENMTTIVVGDINTQDVITKLNNNFKKHSVKKIIPRYSKEKHLNITSEIIEKADVETAYMMMGFNGVDAKNKKENYGLDVLATILGEGVTSRLYKSLKDEKRLAQSVSAYNSSSRDGGIFVINTNFEPVNLDKIKRAIIEEIQTLQKQPPSQEELNEAFSMIERDSYYSRESVSGISSELGYIKTVFDDLDMYDNYVNEIKKITAHEVQLIAKKFLDVNKMAVSIVLPKDFEKVNEKDNSLFEKQNINAKLISDNTGIKKYVLQNNLELLINENNSNDIIAMEIFAKGGKLIEKKSGIGSILANTIKKGTKKYTQDEFSTILEENGIKLTASSDSEYFNISLKTTKNEFSLALELLNEVLNNALLDEYTIEKIKSEKIYALKAARDNPFYVALEEFKDIITQGTPYLRGTTKNIEKALPTITREDVVDYYNSIFDAKNIVVSVNGNLNAPQQTKLINFLGHSFTQKNNLKFDIYSYKSNIMPFSHNIEKKVFKDTQSAWIVLGWKTNGIENEKDFVTLKVINSLLGSGMSSRLFTNLRDEQGLAYQIGSSYAANTNFGFFITYIGTNPKQAQLSKNEILKEIDLLKQEFVTQDELQAAKDKLIGNFILSQETNTEKAETLGDFEVTNRGYDFMNKYPKLIQEVSANDIIKVANKYFSQPYVYTLVSP